MIPFALGALLAKVATVAAIPRAVCALKTFFSGSEKRERISSPEKAPQTQAPSQIPETGTKGIVFTYNSLNQLVTPGTHAFDAAGQATVKDGRTFEWDGAGRMTAIVSGSLRSEFSYDGYGRRVRITEKSGATITSDKLYFWLGSSIVSERDNLVAGKPITKRYFSEGVEVGSTKLYYTFDQLGSVRELIDSSGVVRADYRYSTYGERTKIAGDLDSDWGYAGLWHHAPSGLDLATYRAYDSKAGRWLSRDPLGESVDLNLYRYCGNSPIGFSDPSGLDGTPAEMAAARARRPPHVAPPRMPLDSGGPLAPNAVDPSTVLDHGGVNDNSVNILVGGKGAGAGVSRFLRGRARDAAGNPCPPTRTDPRIRGYQRQIDKHLEKMEAYRRNPDAFDNKGHLRNNPELREKII